MVKNDLNRPIPAQFIRFLPVEWNYKPCMRVEVYGAAIGKNWTNYTPSFREHVCSGAWNIPVLPTFPPLVFSFSDDDATMTKQKNFLGLSFLLRRVHCISCFADCPSKAKNDKCCVFPFTFKGKKYYKCIIDRVWMPWCATTSNFDKDGKWESCLPSTFYAP